MPKASQLRILIVDDQRSMRALIRSSLAQLGCTQCLEAEDGEDALRQLSTFAPDLVISDLNMPKVDGLDLLRAVRASPNRADLAFIMLTSRGEAWIVQEAIKLGINNYLVKPFNLDSLKRKVEAVVGRLT